MSLTASALVKLLSACVFAAAVAAPVVAKDLRFPVQTAPGQAMVPASVDKSLYWIDDDSILYQAIDPPSHPGAIPVQHVVLWNTRSNVTTKLGRSFPTHSPHLCYAKGFLTFATREEEGQYVFLEGALDKLVERRVPIEHIGDSGARKINLKWNRFSCKHVNLDDLGPRRDFLVPLRDGDGYLDVSGGGSSEAVKRRRADIAKLPPREMGNAHFALDHELQARPIVYLPNPYAEEIVLPIKAGEVWGPRMQYSEWSQEYVFAADDTVPKPMLHSWPKGRPHPIYLLKRGGAVSRIDVPYTEWLSGRVVSTVSTRIGILVVSHAVGRRSSVGRAGIYQVSEAGVDRVFEGYVSALAVSPNGCRLAVNAQDLKTSVSRLHVVNLCIRG